MTEPPPEPASKKTWGLMSMILSVLNVVGLLLGGVGIWGFNLWVGNMLAERGYTPTGFNGWVLGLSVWRLVIPFGVIAAAVAFSELFVTNKRATSILNIVVGVGMAIILGVWMKAVLFALFASI